MTSWKITGIIATLAIVLAIPLYRAEEVRRFSGPSAGGDGRAAVFVGSEQCRSCHRGEFEKWLGSHHEKAMAVAGPETVLGDFSDAVFAQEEVTARFYRKDNKYWVFTEGTGGEPQAYEVSHTFGWYPLQQYLVPFPGGRLQCLPFAWDVEGKRWYQLYPGQARDSADWLHWTRQAQNWNGMCAECHSTNLQKNYDLAADSYRTTWSEISVGCEACHGPGSAHVQWAELPEMGRPAVENVALAVKTGGLTSRELIELCAPCHSRRMSLGSNPHANVDFLDYAVPQLLSEGYYFPDGQILEEVYVYGSFMQSKMYARQVRCSDCHDVHSLHRVKEGNALCLQCHQAAVYDTPRHHFHKSPGEAGEPIRSKSGEILFDVGSGAQCEQCHMPGRHYMGIDYRPDHSFRIPSPALTLETGSPNACDRCHADKGTHWSQETIQKWYGQRERSHYGSVLAAGRRRAPEAGPALIALAEDRLYPTIVRATALSLLAAYPGNDAEQSLIRALSDEAALMRHTAVHHLKERGSGDLLRLAGPLLYDPVKAVRIEAARALIGQAASDMTGALRQRYQTVLAEYRRAMEYTGDFPSARHNLGNFYADLGQVLPAIENYRKAIAIDDRFYPAKVNLAMLFNRVGNDTEAERLLREVVDAYPDLYEVHYSLGLLLAQEGQNEAAADHLRRAAAGLPQMPRIQYNLGLLLQGLGRDAEAESALMQALALEPLQPDFLNALAVFYLQRGRLEAARQMARRMTEIPASRNAGREMLDFIRRSESR